jgi:predicted ATPase
MSIQRVQIKGFRSLKDVTWTPGKLNVLIGPNASGKSNLLRALELLQQAAKSEALRESVIRQGGMAPLLWDGRAPAIEWKVDSSVLADESTSYAFGYELSLSRVGASAFPLFVIDREALIEPSTGGMTRMLLKRDSHGGSAWDDTSGRLLPFPLETMPEDETLLSQIDPRKILAHLWRSRLGLWPIYHDLQVHQAAACRQAAVMRYEKRLDANGDNLVPVLHTLYSEDSEFEKSVDQAMRAAFSDQFEKLLFTPAADGRIQLRVRWKHLEVAQSAANLSDGTLRFLMLLAILANPSPGELIAIDEPETGLHPGMFPIIAEFAAAASEKATVILTTHSPQFLDAFPEHAVPTTTVAQWIDGETQLSVLDGDELRRWLKSYSLGSLFRSGELEGLA